MSEEKTPSSPSTIALFLIILIAGVGPYYLTKSGSSLSNLLSAQNFGQTNQRIISEVNGTQPPADPMAGYTLVSTPQVNNLGESFHLGQIDDPIQTTLPMTSKIKLRKSSTTLMSLQRFWQTLR